MPARLLPASIECQEGLLLGIVALFRVPRTSAEMLLEKHGLALVNLACGHQIGLRPDLTDLVAAVQRDLLDEGTPGPRDPASVEAWIRVSVGFLKTNQ